MSMKLLIVRLRNFSAIFVGKKSDSKSDSIIKKYCLMIFLLYKISMCSNSESDFEIRDIRADEVGI